MGSIMQLFMKIAVASPTLVPKAVKLVEDAINGPGGVGKVEAVIADLEALIATGEQVVGS
ncbi:MAG: hypothetical protein KGO96_10500 [Elusimicrobia bacterium]|nr:hypothetical protein [Elusimicrobiota bacterium]